MTLVSQVRGREDAIYVPFFGKVTGVQFGCKVGVGEVVCAHNWRTRKGCS